MLLIASFSLIHEQFHAPRSQGHALSDDDIFDGTFKGIGFSLYGGVHEVLDGKLEGSSCQYA
jgi:hypothetical protein